MKYKKQYCAVHLETVQSNDKFDVNLSFGRDSGGYNGYSSPAQWFDSEQEAIEFAYSENKWQDWSILTRISFDNF